MQLLVGCDLKFSANSRRSLHLPGGPVPIAQHMPQDRLCSFALTAGRLQGRAGGSHICWALRPCRKQRCTCNQHGTVAHGLACARGCHSTPERYAEQWYSRQHSSRHEQSSRSSGNEHACKWRVCRRRTQSAGQLSATSTHAVPLPYCRSGSAGKQACLLPLRVSCRLCICWWAGVLPGGRGGYPL
jgi:hypothetical protein